MDNQNIPATQVFLVNVSEDATTINVRKTNEIETTLQINLENAENLSTVCRTCATTSDYVIPIFQGEGLQNNLAEKIHQHLPIEVTREDCLPQVMCYQCASTLLAWHELEKCCRRADQLLREVWQRPTQTEAPSTSSNNVVPEQSLKPDNQLDRASLKSYIKEVLQIYRLEEYTAYMCQQCDHHTYSSMDFLIHHLENKHISELNTKDDVKVFVQNNITTIEVLEDETNFCDAEEPFQKHTKVATIASIPCPFCDSIFSTNLKLLHHLNVHSDKVTIGNLYHCKVCQIETNDKKKFIKHFLVHFKNKLDNSQFRCRSCNFVTDDQEHLSQHISKNHQIESKPVKISPIKFVAKLRTTKYITIECPECKKIFSNKYNMLRHKLNHGTSKTLVSCGICLKTYKSRSSLKYHQGIAHQGLSPFVCKTCGETFATRNARDVHARIHSGETPYSCPQCHKAFRAKNTLLRHIDMHLDVRNYLCTLCGKKFRRKSHLDTHLTTHNKREASDAK